uniref:Uncharacterized protein n=1 Tax=Trichogramma kaykai TaxID=54128 RepID=A0ABD2XR67_9HYME
MRRVTLQAALPLHYIPQLGLGNAQCDTISRRRARIREASKDDAQDRVDVLLAVLAAPATKNELSDELSPLNEVSSQSEDDSGATNVRAKRKIGAIKLGAANGLMNFVFGKIDALLDAGTKSLSTLDDSNKAKNLIYEIDPDKSATSEFISKFLAQKARASAGGIGPLINAGSTFLSSAKQGIFGAVASKFAPLSSLSGGLSSGVLGSSSGGGEDGENGGGGSNSGSFLTGIVGSLSGGSGGGNGGGGLASLSSLSGNLSGNGGDAATDDEEVDFPTIPEDDASSSNDSGYPAAGAGYAYSPPLHQPYQRYYHTYGMSNSYGMRIRR